MAKRSRVQKRKPRYSGPASDCISIFPDGTIQSFSARPKGPKRTSVVTLPNGELIVRITDL